MRLGISSYTYVWSVGVPGFPHLPKPLSALGLLRKAVDLPVRVVQIADNLPMHMLSDAELDEVIRLAKGHGISLELGTCGMEVRHLRRYLQLASQIASPILRVVTDTVGHKPSPDEIVGTIQQISAELSATNVCLAIENHDRLCSGSLRKIMELCDTEHVGICLDTANSLGCGEGLETVVNQLGPWVVNVHVKDFQIVRLPHGKGFAIEGRPAGQGQLNIPWLLEKLRALHRSTSAIVELWPPLQATLAESIALEERWTTESVAYLRKLIPD